MLTFENYLAENYKTIMSGISKLFFRVMNLQFGDPNLFIGMNITAFTMKSILKRIFNIRMINIKGLVESYGY